MTEVLLNQNPAISRLFNHGDPFRKEYLLFMQRKTLPLLSSVVLVSMVAGCGEASLPNLPSTGPISIPLPGNVGSIEFPGFGGSQPGTQPGTSQPAPQVPPVAALPPSLPAGSSGIKVFVNQAMHPASSFVLATNRNHVTDYFPNGAAKLEKLKELRPDWGGARYMYRIGHGPTDGRHDYNYMTGYHFEKHWNKNGGYPYDDIRNALREANTLDAEQLHVVNFGTGSPEEAARYVSYLNNPNDANRAKYPYPVQNAKFFEIGNEISWSKVRGHKEYASTDIKYAQRAKQFAQAMRKASPVPIQIGAVASTNSNWMGEGWAPKGQGVKNILQTMGEDVDFLIYHGYPSWPIANKGGDKMTIMAQNAWNDRLLTNEIVPAIEKYAKKDVYIANTEFFTEMYNDVKTARGMFGALYSADTLTLAFKHDIRIANQFCIDHQDMADASFFVGNDPNTVTPIFMFNKLLAKTWGDTVVKVEGQAIPSVHVKGPSDSIDMPKLAFTASKGRDGKVYVMVTNRTNDSDVTTNVALGFTPKAATAHVLKGSNGWASDHTNTSVSSASANLSKAYTFPRASVTIFEITP